MERPGAKVLCEFRTLRGAGRPKAEAGILPIPVKSPPSWRHGMPGAMGVRPLRSALMAFAADA